MQSNISSTPANTMGAGDPVLPLETNTGNIGINMKNKCKRKKKMKSLKEFVETDNITEAAMDIKNDKGIEEMLKYAHNNPPQTIVVEYTKLRYPLIKNEKSRGILKLTSTGKEYDSFNKKFLISGTYYGFRNAECVVHVGKDKDFYLMIDVLPKDKYEPQVYVEYDNYYYEE